MICTTCKEKIADVPSTLEMRNYEGEIINHFNKCSNSQKLYTDFGVLTMVDGQIYILISDI